jgi:hypothetical protein
VKLARKKPRGGQSTDVTAKVRLPEQPGDLGASLRIRADDGTRTTVTVAMRGRVATSRTSPTHFAGTITGGNGRSATAEGSTFELDVPTGRPSLSVGVRLTDQLGVRLTDQQDPGTGVFGYTETVRTQLFDAAVTTSTGSLWAAALVQAPPEPAHARSRQPTHGARWSGTISVVLTPRAEDRGRTVRVALDVGSADPLLGTGDEVATLPYAYTVG